MSGFTGRKHSEETKKKMSESRSGKNNPMYGKTRNMSEETRKKMSESHKGKTGANKGKTWEEMYGEEKAKEMRKKLLERTKGNQHWKKRIITKEIRRKMSKNSKLTIEQIEERYPLFFKIEGLRYNPDKPRSEYEIQVHCKNHNCKNSVEQEG